MNVFDLFCGTGGFSYGIDSANLGFETRLGIDMLPIAVKTFQANHPRAIGLPDDIRKLRRAEIAEHLKLKRGDVHVIVGGPPCQGFSSIRPFRSCNEDDPRNSLFEEFASFVNYFRPHAFVLENVVGLATHRNGSTIDMMEDCFKNLGYETEWRILNCAHFGVPQKRERLIMIGSERGARIIFPRHTHASSSSTIGFRDRSKMHFPEEPSPLAPTQPALVPALSVMDAISDLPAVRAGEEIAEYSLQPLNDYQRARRSRSRDLSWHVATAHTKKMMEIIEHSGKNINSIPKHLITSGFSSCYSRLDADEPAVTITVNFVHPASNRCIHPVQNRALTPREGARLQSFDDDYVFVGNRSQIVKQIGNAVPPVLGQHIAQALHEML